MPKSERLPSWAADIEDAKTRCRHCGQVITVVTGMGYFLTDNGSYFCDPATMQQPHEAAMN